MTAAARLQGKREILRGNSAISAVRGASSRAWLGPARYLTRVRESLGLSPENKEAVTGDWRDNIRRGLERQLAGGHEGALSLENRINGPGCVARLRLPV